MKESARIVRHIDEDVDELLFASCHQVTVGKFNRVQVEVGTVYVVQKLLDD